MSQPPTYPWNHADLEGFSIVGMNHYHVEGVRHLFVAMVGAGGRCIKAENEHEVRVWKALRDQAQELAAWLMSDTGKTLDRFYRE